MTSPNPLTLLNPITPLNPITTLLGTGNNGASTISTLPTSVSTAGIGSAVTGAVSSVASGVAGIFGLTSSRIIAIILGLICIIGAILLYLGEDIAGAVGVGKRAVAGVAE